MQEEIQKVVESRRAQQEIAAHVEALTRKFKADNAELFAAHDTAKQVVAAAENALREAILVEFKATGNKKPAPGCGVRVSTVLRYEPQAALTWAETNAPAAIKRTLDAKAFEALAKVQQLEFVTVEEVPTATISPDLTDAAPLAA